jgi:hypothetical protein
MSNCQQWQLSAPVCSISWGGTSTQVLGLPAAQGAYWVDSWFGGVWFGGPPLNTSFFALVPSESPREMQGLLPVGMRMAFEEWDPKPSDN